MRLIRVVIPILAHKASYSTLYLNTFTIWVRFTWSSLLLTALDLATRARHKTVINLVPDHWLSTNSIRKNTDMLHLTARCIYLWEIVYLLWAFSLP